MISPVAALSGLPDESWVLRAVRLSATGASSGLPEAASLSSQSPIMGNAASIPSRSTPPCKDAMVESRAAPTSFDSTSLLSAGCSVLTSPVSVPRALPLRYGAPHRTENGPPNRHGFPEVTRGYPTSTPSGKEANGRTGSRWSGRRPGDALYAREPTLPGPASPGSETVSRRRGASPLYQALSATVYSQLERHDN